MELTIFKELQTIPVRFFTNPVSVERTHRQVRWKLSAEILLRGRCLKLSVKMWYLPAILLFLNLR